MFSRFAETSRDFALLDEFRRRLDRVWEDMDPSWPAASASNAAPHSSSAWPRVNVYDGGSNLVVKADLPGLSEKDVQVTLNESGLAISGRRTVAPPEGYSAHRQERSSFSFSRSLTLPCKVNPDQTQASVKNGVLTVTLAKAPEAQPRQIAVQAH
jgi:HSP20 family protein